jgi:DNA-binding response OmpR family regulator
MTYGICPVCGSIPKLPLELRMLHLAARPTTILNYLYAFAEKKVAADFLATQLKISRPTLSVHISRIRSEFRLSNVAWHIVSLSSHSYSLIRAVPHDEDNSAQRTETSHP